MGFLQPPQWVLVESIEISLTRLVFSPFFCAAVIFHIFNNWRAFSGVITAHNLSAHVHFQPSHQCLMHKIPNEVTSQHLIHNVVVGTHVCCICIFSQALSTLSCLARGSPPQYRVQWHLSSDIHPVIKLWVWPWFQIFSFVSFQVHLLASFTTHVYGCLFPPMWEKSRWKSN